MILKTKLLLSLVTLGVVGGTGTGVYYLQNKDSSGEKIVERQDGNDEVLPGVDGKDGKVVDIPKEGQTSRTGTVTASEIDQDSEEAKKAAAEKAKQAEEAARQAAAAAEAKKAAA